MPVKGDAIHFPCFPGSVKASALPQNPSFLVTALGEAGKQEGDHLPKLPSWSLLSESQLWLTRGCKAQLLPLGGLDP